MLIEIQKEVNGYWVIVKQPEELAECIGIYDTVDEAKQCAESYTPKSSNVHQVHVLIGE